MAAGAINLNYAINAGLDPKSALVIEDKDSPFGLVWAARARARDDPHIAKLIAIYRSPEVKQFTLNRFGSTIFPT